MNFSLDVCRKRDILFHLCFTIVYQNIFKLSKGIDIASTSLQRIQNISSALAEERAPAFYAERSYSADEAQEAGKNAEFVYKTFASLIK